MSFKKVVFGSLAVIFGLITVLGGISGLIMAVVGDKNDMGLFEGLIGLLMWAGLTYWFFRLYKKADDKSESYRESGDDEEFGIEKDLDWSEGTYSEDEIAYVNGSPVYRFDYFDAKGDYSHRRVKVNSIERKNGQLYINALDLDKHANRTFRVENIDSLVVEDTGEMVDDDDVSAHFSGVFA